MQLVAQEQVLDDKVVPLTDEGGQSREEDAEEFKHPGRVADRAGRSFALLQRQTSWSGQHSVRELSRPGGGIC